MGDYGQPSYLPLHWNAHQSLMLANEAPARNYRKVLSRVTKPSSAGNSPHSHARSRNAPQAMPINTDVFSIQNSSSVQSTVSIQSQKQPRPTSWHPSLRQLPYYVPNCHPSWLRDVSVSDLEPQPGMASMYSLSTPITCPMSGDLLSTNDYFATQSESYNYLPPGPQAYTPVEPPDMLFSEPSEWSTFGMDGTPLSAYPWMQNPIASTDAAVDFCCHESVASADDPTAPPTPDQNPQDCPPSGVKGDDLVALGLYDEPQPLSFSSALLGGGYDDFACHRTGKGLKLEETFTPTPEADDEDDEDADADADDEDGEEQ
ncbi:hypothetical protein UA08_06555 [Talaromyces atroroseus]|uniref:Uncharacterized protein n=1 Tax=Talaromyces atroroseus TaxID=1441469 RepID=A0A225ACT6_TALAT|nr:hypothetical protein UA08_06555 [Talaromyces atroroseus]OKL58210.1 hypothetical protein UA08_06555 [Talaromyces atroroseus]